MTMEEMIEKFQLKDVHKSGAMFDVMKLDWMNGEYIKRMKIGELHARLAKYLEEYEEDFYRHTFSQRDYEYNTRIIHELQTRMKRFDEYTSLTKSLYGEAQVRKDLLVNPKMKIETETEALESLKFVFPLLEVADYSSLDAIKAPILEAI